MVRTKQKGTLVATILYHSARRMKDFLVALAQLGYAEEANHPPASTKAPVHQSMHTCTKIRATCCLSRIVVAMGSRLSFHDLARGLQLLRPFLQTCMEVASWSSCLTWQQAAGSWSKLTTLCPAQWRSVERSYLSFSNL